MACNLPLTLDGCKISASVGFARTDCETPLTKADYETLSFTFVGGVETGGFTGQEWGTHEIKPLSGSSKTSKTILKPGTLEAKIYWDKDDAGMAIIEAGYSSKTDEVAVKVEYPNGEVRYGQGLVTKLPLPSGGKEDIMYRDAVISLNDEPIAG